METALKRAIAWQVERVIVKNISKSEIARAIRTGHAALDRGLDPNNEVGPTANHRTSRTRLELA